MTQQESKTLLPLFPLSGIQRNIKTVAMIFLSGPTICKATSLIVGPLQSQLAIFWSSLKHLVSMEKVNWEGLLFKQLIVDL